MKAIARLLRWFADRIDPTTLTVGEGETVILQSGKHTIVAQGGSGGGGGNGGKGGTVTFAGPYKGGPGASP